MKERINNLHFDFEFLRKEPHSTMDDLHILNGGIHLTNHLIDHRSILGSTVDIEAGFLDMGDVEKRLCRSIIEQIEKVGGGSYRTLPVEVLDEGRRQAMITLDEMWKPIFEEMDKDPIIRANIQKGLAEIKKVKPHLSS